MFPPDSCHYQFIQCGEYYGRYDLSFGHDLIEYRRVDDVTGKLFLLVFYNMTRNFWKCLREYFGLSKWRPRKKFSRSSSQVAGENGENVLTGRNLDKSCCRVSLLRETCSFKNVFLINLSWATEDVKNLFEETVCKLYTLIIKFKRHPPFPIGSNSPATSFYLQLALIKFGRRLQYAVKWREKHRLTPEKSRTEKPWEGFWVRTVSLLEPWKIAELLSKNIARTAKKKKATQRKKSAVRVWSEKICRSRRMSSHHTKGLVINRRLRTGSLEDFTKNFKKFRTLVHWSTMYFVYCYECTALTYFYVTFMKNNTMVGRSAYFFSNFQNKGLPSSGLQLQRFLWNLCGILII